MRFSGEIDEVVRGNCGPKYSLITSGRRGVDCHLGLLGFVDRLSGNRFSERLYSTRADSVWCKVWLFKGNIIMTGFWKVIPSRHCNGTASTKPSFHPTFLPSNCSPLWEYNQICVDSRSSAQTKPECKHPSNASRKVVRSMSRSGAVIVRTHSMRKNYVRVINRCFPNIEHTQSSLLTLTVRVLFVWAQILVLCKDAERKEWWNGASGRWWFIENSRKTRREAQK